VELKEETRVTSTRTRTAVAAAATLAAVLAATGSAAADSTTAPTTTAPTTTAPTAKSSAPAAARLCKRVPKVDARVDRDLARLNGPATKRGSVARLQKRVDTATSKGEAAVETYLKDRLTFRKSLIPTLTKRSTDLNAVRTWCGTQHAGGKAATT
jgi:hypothetical protein